jgi:hypothetical protein
MFNQQFEAMAGDNSWETQEVTHLLTTIYRQAVDILYNVPVKVMYKDIVLKGR